MPRINSFNVGDRVRVNRSCVIDEWWGEEGVVSRIFKHIVQVRLDKKISGSHLMNLSADRWDLIADEPVVEEDWS